MFVLSSYLSDQKSLTAQRDSRIGFEFSLVRRQEFFRKSQDRAEGCAQVQRPGATARYLNAMAALDAPAR